MGARTAKRHPSALPWGFGPLGLASLWASAPHEVQGKTEETGALLLPPPAPLRHPSPPAPALTHAPPQASLSLWLPGS